jgi:perosamine synthetase
MPAVLGGPPVRPEGPPDWPPRDPEIIAVLHALAQDGGWGRYSGAHAERLLALLRETHQVEHAWLCSSGTAAVELALRGVDVRPGDEVVLAAYDFKANFTNVLTLGATPVLVDVNSATWQMDVRQLPAAVSPRTKAIVVSHLHGGMVEMPAVMAFAAERQLAVVEDACQCPGITIAGRPAGTWGDVGVLSFGGSKLVSAGRGGAVVTPRTNIYERIRRYVLRGNDAYPLSELQAAVIAPQWLKLQERHLQRAAAATELLAALESEGGLTPWQRPSPTLVPGYYKLGFEYRPEAFDGLSRNAFCRAMRAEGIALDPGFRALHRIHASRRFRTAGLLASADQADATVVTLHHPVLLESSASFLQIVAAVRKIQRSAALLRSSGLDAAADQQEYVE